MGGKEAPFEVQIGVLLRERGISLSTAESCSGGLISHRITNVAGSSHYFSGGVVAYSNDAKMEMLGVQEETLTKHGAVSEAVAREMARGARQRFHSDLAVAVTGIAGPGGGTGEKPVGLVYMALSAADEERAEYKVFSGGREDVKAHSAERALGLILEYLS